jgi:hypothetical protein
VKEMNFQSSSRAGQKMAELGFMGMMVDPNTAVLD